VAAPVSLRHEDLDWAAVQLAPPVPKNSFNLRIDEDDPAIRVNDDHGIRRRFQEAAELFFGFPVLSNLRLQSPDGFCKLRGPVLNTLFQLIVRSLQRLPNSLALGDHDCQRESSDTNDPSKCLEEK